MGGYGSGRRVTQPAVEDGLVLDLTTWRRLGMLVPGARRSGITTWTAQPSGNRLATMAYEADMRDGRSGGIRLRYTPTQHDGRKADHDYTIMLTTTEPPFGGLRWWFVCPRTGLRVTKLYMPPGAERFAGRRAFRMAYRSQRASEMDRGHAAQRRIVEKLGGEYRFSDPPPPPRPKWMRWRTYWRWCADLENAEEQMDRVFIAGAAKLLQRYGRSLD